MSSPVLNVLLARIRIDRDSELPIYVQISNAITQLVNSGLLAAGQKIPGSRTLAGALGVHRKTINMAFDELLQQGYLEGIPQKGTFIPKSIPKLEPRQLISENVLSINERAAFSFKRHEKLKFPFLTPKSGLILDEGLPDLRLSPIQEIQRTYRNVLSRTYNLKHWSYGSPFGDEGLREEYARYLRSTRGLSVEAENVLITRGSQMAIFLAASLVLKKGSKVAVGHLNYQTANHTLEHFGAKLLGVPIDHEGIDTNAIEDICKRDKLTAVYVTPHHHHPTTATLTAERRIHLLQLATAYGFAIIEDDYDYDFHYERSPLLPLASSDHDGHVLYIGGISKVVSPALRIGFLVGPKDFIASAAYYRRIVDRQGDNIMERTIAQLLANGDIARHSKKALKVYHERRNSFAEKLNGLSDYLSYSLPSGGMAFWVRVNSMFPLEKLTAEFGNQGLEIPYWKSYDPHLEYHNCVRMGFASLNSNEIDQVFEIMNKVFNP